MRGDLVTVDAAPFLSAERVALRRPEPVAAAARTV